MALWITAPKATRRVYPAGEKLQFFLWVHKSKNFSEVKHLLPSNQIKGMFLTFCVGPYSIKYSIRIKIV